MLLFVFLPFQWLLRQIICRFRTNIGISERSHHLKGNYIKVHRSIFVIAEESGLFLLFSYLISSLSSDPFYATPSLLFMPVVYLLSHLYIPCPAIIRLFTNIFQVMMKINVNWLLLFFIGCRCLQSFIYQLSLQNFYNK